MPGDEPDKEVYPDDVALVGGRRFWIYRGQPAEDAADWSARFNAQFETLDADFEPSQEGPLGICVYVTDRGVIESRPEVVWPDTELMYVGYLADETQVRIRYFTGALI